MRRDCFVGEVTGEIGGRPRSPPRGGSGELRLDGPGELPDRQDPARGFSASGMWSSTSGHRFELAETVVRRHGKSSVLLASVTLNNAGGPLQETAFATAAMRLPPLPQPFPATGVRFRGI